MENEGVVLGEIFKSETDKIVIRLNEYDGFKLVDIRTFYSVDDRGFLPTKKGITLSSKGIEAIINILTKAKTQVN